ncbi:Hypothetical_protein [Hexamita inflata]|uniref:Hypothetical_protein n=1 Tax=Hexamita inflata TaxID=28002 RepID=A0AA86NNP2_9EUKA|nr:Hypothetical protein HINF_LOCUS10551 [Hexamita inflata]CAI9922909.1 Hypothetical protein HINF_LOCUS10554 [Hexamita inflata]
MNYGKQTVRSLFLDSELAEQFRHRVVLSHVVLQALYVEPGLDLDIRNGQQIKKLSFFTLKICEQLQQKAFMIKEKHGKTDLQNICIAKKRNPIKIAPEVLQSDTKYNFVIISIYSYFLVYLNSAPKIYREMKLQQTTEYPHIMKHNNKGK